MTYQPNNLSGANVKGFVFFANRKAARIVFFLWEYSNLGATTLHTPSHKWTPSECRQQENSFRNCLPKNWWT